MSNKEKIYIWLSILYIVLTGGINVFGYFNLPTEIATKLSFSGKPTNHMSTPLYLILTFGIVLLISVFTITKGQEKKLKYLLVNSIIVLANIFTVVIQL